MKLNILPDYQSLSAQVANELIELIRIKPHALFCFASGDTPRLACQMIAQRGIKEKLDFSQCSFVGLDEWLGIPPENEGSCHYFFKTLLIGPLKFSADQYFLFDALSRNPSDECLKMDEHIRSKGGIDLMVVGIGMNGHIGFNEPGVSFENYSHVADLDTTTVTVGQKYFNGPVKLGQGITLGFKHLLESKRVILMANGKKKAGVVAEAVEGEITNKFPASVMQQHPGGEVMIDEEASSKLSLNISHSENQ
jgi:glucosamine-6-phosphate isomerase